MAPIPAQGHLRHIQELSIKLKKCFYDNVAAPGRERSRSQVTPGFICELFSLSHFHNLWQSEAQVWFWILALSLYLCIGFHAVNSFYEHFRNLTVSKEWRNLHYFIITVLIQAGYFKKILSLFAFLTLRGSVIYIKRALLWTFVPNQRCSVKWWIWEIIILATTWDCN